MRKPDSANTPRKLLGILAAVYAAGMLLLLFGRTPALRMGSYWQRVRMACNLRPLRTIAMFSRHLRRGDPIFHWAAMNIFGNILLFLPLGMFPPLLWKKFRSLPGTMVLALAVMTGVEVAQALLQVGTCDVDDLILNLIGAAIGYFLLKILKIFPGIREKA